MYHYHSQHLRALSILHINDDDDDDDGDDDDSYDDDDDDVHQTTMLYTMHELHLQNDNHCCSVLFCN